MKILIRNVDNVVICAQPDLTLSAEGTHGDGWFSPHFTTANARLEEAQLPGLWRGGVWSYVGGVWTVVDAAAHAALLEQVSAHAREAAKSQRAAAVAAIKVTTSTGHTFDGDETSQGRMARAIIALSTGLAPGVSWVLADNTVIEATAAELTEALVLAGMAQAAVWVIE